MYQPADLAIYIHWPFCKSKCPYCDFYKEVKKNVNQEQIVDEYLAALQKYYELTAGRIVKSVFFGGGTPSLMEPRQIARILDFIAQKWTTAENIEISLEANPNSHYKNMFADLKNAGINRLSLGIQALNDDDLRFLGRTHNLLTARKCIEEVVSVFQNHSVDLIYARPQQKIENWQQELTEISSYGLKHLSLYQLTIEKNTIFDKKKIKPLSEDAAAKIYNITRDFLQNKGYVHYEVSNFAQEGFQSVHNLTYWQGGDYLGIGTSAHGRIFVNGQHIATEYPFQHTVLTAEERAYELIIMGLRLTEGINKSYFKQICGLDFDDFINQEQKRQLITLGLLKDNKNFVQASYDGMLLLNEIILRLCS